MNELDGLHALIIEPHAGMRATLHNMLGLCGLTKVDHAGSSNQAVKHLSTKQFDLILCEYGLEGGQDGQQLLEDLRHHKLMPLATMFFMVTAEGDYGKVVSAAELGPTDYILKPFTADLLLDRIARALRRIKLQLPQRPLLVGSKGVARVMGELIGVPHRLELANGVVTEFDFADRPCLQTNWSPL